MKIKILVVLVLSALLFSSNQKSKLISFENNLVQSLKTQSHYTYAGYFVQNKNQKQDSINSNGEKTKATESNKKNEPKTYSIYEEPYFIWILISASVMLLAILIFTILSFIKLLKISKSVKGINIIQDRVKELLNNNANQRISNGVRSKEIDTRLIENKLSEILIRLQNNSEEIKINKLNEPDSIKKRINHDSEPNIITKYAELPEKGDFFIEKDLTNREQPRSLYKIIMTEGKDNMHFDILTENYNIHRSAMNTYDVSISPACEFENMPLQTDKKIIKTTKELGTLERENGKLRITKKLKITFGS